MADIFVSYASADLEIAQTLAGAFARRGHSVWWDRTIPPGRVFDDVIQEALSEARCVIVLWSATSVRSNWVKAEASDALSRHRLVPARIDDALPPFEFRRIQAANLAGWNGDTDDPEFASLLASVERLIAQPPAAAATPAARPAAPRPRASGSRSRWGVIALVAAGAVAAVAYLLGIVPGVNGKPAVPSPQGPSSEQRPAASLAGRVNLVAAENGGELLAAADESWKNTVDGDARTYGWVSSINVGKADATFGFKDGRAATFDSVAVLITSLSDSNVREFELLAGNDGPLGSFRSVGVFTVANMLMAKQPFQSFSFPPVTARAVRIRPLSSQGPQAAIFIHEWQLLGTPAER
jgi:hypothetical protein